MATASWTDESGSHSVSWQVRMYTGNENSAAFGTKTVDKTVVSTDPDDQLVTYTIKFRNDQGFSAGAIQLVDELDSHVGFVSAEPNEYYAVEQDPSDPQRLVIRNTNGIDGSSETYVTFTTDFTNVPVGYTVANTVGGNTTKTTKCGGGLVLAAKKTIDGSGTPTDGQFAFELLSADGTVLQTKRNDGDGVEGPAFDGRRSVGRAHLADGRHRGGPDRRQRAGGQESPTLGIGDGGVRRGAKRHRGPGGMPSGPLPFGGICMANAHRAPTGKGLSRGTKGLPLA